MAAPTVPPRPSRSQNVPADAPSIPPRPIRSMERSVSPNRDSFARSPLNDPSFLHVKPNHGTSALHKTLSRDLPERPPSVSLPSVGQEGAEYAQLDQIEPDVESTKVVAEDLPLHAPKASLPVLAAKSKIQTVTRTDSDSAAAYGIGKPRSETGDHPLTKTVSHTASSQAGSRPSSVFRMETEDDEHGIPKIGIQAPLAQNAGDVQAPTPSSSVPPPATGVGFFNKGDGGQRNHYRTKSGREVFNGPPGSYGLRGHGVTDHDPLEKAWYDKHPDAKAQENQGEYGPKIPMDRQDYHLSSAKLNALINKRDQQAQEHVIVGTPDEQIGYLASDEYSHRISTPDKVKRRSAQYSESPLKAVNNNAATEDTAIDDDDDDEVIHVDEPHRARSTPGTTPKGPLSVVGDEDDENDRPILPSDEHAMQDRSRYLTPAIEIDRERRASDSYESLSRPQSRTGSGKFQAPALASRPSLDHRESTPLDNVKEYEPLFPEDEDDELRKKRRSSYKEDEKPRHYFRSKDVWEDTPDSLMYETTVDTPQLAEFSVPSAEHEPKELFQDEKPKPVSKVPKSPGKSMFNKDITSEMRRPQMRHRFPSQDTWEDAPDSSMYTAELDNDDDDSDEEPSKSKETPTVPARPNRSGDSGIERKTAPDVPDRPKPALPAKEKPPVPSRPLGSKIAALRGGFMNDLESRLKGGPQAVTKAPEKELDEEESAEKPALADARKSRAKGPARRRPGGGDSGATSADAPAPRPKVSFVSAVTVWSVDEDGMVTVGSKSTRPAEKEGPTDAKDFEDEAATVETAEA